jgi:hypothetical protein
VGRIDLSQDRGHWSALANMVTNLLVPQKSENFLTKWVLEILVGLFSIKLATISHWRTDTNSRYSNDKRRNVSCITPFRPLSFKLTIGTEFSRDFLPLLSQFITHRLPAVVRLSEANKSSLSSSETVWGCSRPARAPVLACVITWFTVRMRGCGLQGYKNKPYKFYRKLGRIKSWRSSISITSHSPFSHHYTWNIELQVGTAVTNVVCYAEGTRFEAPLFNIPYAFQPRFSLEL